MRICWIEKSFMYYLTNFLKGTFLFVLILLIGSGWSFFKPHLSSREKKILLFIIVLQIIDNLAVAILAFETENERMYNDWSTILHLVDIVSCCALLLPIVWQVNTLEETVEVANVADDSNTTSDVDEENTDISMSASKGTGVPVEETPNDATTSRLQSKLHLFRSFYLVVVAYIYFTRIIVYLFESSLQYDQTWIRTFVYELGTLAFYFVVGMKFKPVDESYDMDYSKVETGGQDDNNDEVDEDIDDITSLLPQKERSLKQKQIELSSMLANGKVAMD